MELNRRNQPEKLIYIDALRGYAILGVMAVHISQTEKLYLSDGLLNLFSQGFRGVQLFFMVSAFTLFASFSKRINYEKAVLLNFYIRRFFRIAPMYYLAILFYSLYYNLPNVELGVLLNLLLMHGFSVEWINKIVPGGWSVGIEFLFYAILPILFFKIKTSNDALNFYILSLLIKGVSFMFLPKVISVYPKESIEYFIYFSLPNQLPVFALGIILFFILNRDDWSFKQFSNYSILSLVGIFMYTLIYSSNIFFDKNDFYCILFFVFFLILTRTKNKLLINRFICYIGQISYSIYLVHFGVLFWVSNYFYFIYFKVGIIDFILRFSIIFIFSVIISSITYYLIEINFQKLGKNLITKITKE